MPEIVTYIIGAGFSAPLGLPVMRNFLEKSKDLYLSNRNKYQHFEQIFRTIRELSICKTYYEADLTNIEEILSILDMKRFSLDGRVDSFADYVCDVINGYTPHITPATWSGRPADWHKRVFGEETSAQDYGVFVANILGLKADIAYPTMFDGSAAGGHRLYVRHSENGNAKYNIITLNYDTVLEGCLEHLRVNCDIVEDEVRFREVYSGKNMLLAKLHGCAQRRFVIPPTWAKTQNEEIQRSWSQAYAALEAANHVRVLGYSLPISDSYIRYLFKACVVRSEHVKRIDVICRDDDRGFVQRRYSDFITFPNYRFLNGNIGDYLRMLAELTRLETTDGQRSSVSYDRLEEAHEKFMNR